MRLIERDRELGVLESIFDDTCHGKARIALVAGAVGTGKSALLDAFICRTRHSGALFITATASWSECKLPLAVIDQLLRSADLSAETTRITQLLDGALTAATRLSGIRRIPDQRFALMLGNWINSLWALLRCLAEEHPLVIVVDDAHNADEASLQCLLYLVRRLRSARLLLLLTTSVRGNRPSLPYHAEFLSDADSQVIPLRPLSAQGAASMLAAVLSGAAASQLAGPFHQASGGSPLLLSALADDYRASSPGAPAAGPDDAFRHAVANCLWRCKPLTQEVARAIAVLDEPAPGKLLDELLELSATSSREAITELSLIGLLQDGRFRHEAARTAMLETMTPDKRAATRLRAACLLHEYGAAPTTVARHLLAADKADMDWAIRLLQDAADAALADGKAADAVVYLRLALRSCGDQQQRAAIIARLASAEWWGDPSAVARHLPELMTAACEGRLSEQQVGRTIAYLMWLGRPDEALDLITTLETSHARARDSSRGEGSNAAPEAVQHRARLWFSCFYPDLQARLTHAQLQGKHAHLQGKHAHLQGKHAQLQGKKCGAQHDRPGDRRNRYGPPDC